MTPVAMSDSYTLASSNPLPHSFLRVEVEICTGIFCVVKTQPWAHMGLSLASVPPKINERDPIILYDVSLRNIQKCFRDELRIKSRPLRRKHILTAIQWKKRQLFC